MKSVGIDIGSYSIKIAEVESTPKAFVIRRFDEFKLSQDPAKDTEIEVLDFLRNLATQYDPQNTRFVFGLKQQLVSLRRRTFPFKERHKILKSVAFELEDDIPFSQEDAIFDAKICKYRGHLAEVIAMACPRVHVEKMVQLSQDSNLDISVLSVEGMAFANLFEKWREQPPQEALPKDFDEEEEDQKNQARETADLLIDIGHKNTIITILKDGGVHIIRHVDWGGQDIAKAVASKYSLHYVEAIKEVEKKAFILLNNQDVTSEQIVFSDCIKKCVDQLANHLKLVLLELSSEYHLEFQRAILVGGACQIKNIGPYLTQKIGLAANRLKHLSNYPQVDFASSPHNEVASTIAIGLAIEGIKRPKNPPVNFLKEEFARKNQNLKLFWDKWKHSIQVSAAMFIVFFSFSIMRENLTVEMADLGRTQMKNQASSIAGLTGLNATFTKISSYITKQKQVVKTWDSAKRVPDLTSSMLVLKKISDLLPKGNVAKINIRRLDIVNQGVIIEGDAKSTTEVVRIKNKLKTLAIKGQLQNTTPSFKAVKGRKIFGFKFNVNRMSGG